VAQTTIHEGEGAPPEPVLLGWGFPYHITEDLYAHHRLASFELCNLPPCLGD
jgi:hypothetical protein